MKPRIGYDNLFVRFRDNLSASSPETAGNIGNWLTGPDSAWIMQGGLEVVSVSLPSPLPADYFAICRHNLVGATIVARRAVGASWETVASHTVIDRDAVFISFPEQSSSGWRLQISNAPANSYLAVASIGKRMDLERGVFVGHDPITENERTVSVDNLSESGQFLGRKLIRMGASSSIDVDNISADWARDHWRPFRKHAQQFPFFWQWDPKHHDDEVSLCWQSGDPSLSNSGVGYLAQKGRLALSMPINGIVR